MFFSCFFCVSRLSASLSRNPTPLRHVLACTHFSLSVSTSTAFPKDLTTAVLSILLLMYFNNFHVVTFHVVTFHVSRLTDLNRQESDRRWATAKAVKGAFPVAIDRESNIVLHGACSTVWRRVDEGPPPGNIGEGGLTGAEAAAAATTAYVPRCVCALSFDPLFDTLRAVALARGGFPEAGRALMVGGGGSIESGGGGGAPAAAVGARLGAPWNDDDACGRLGAARGAGGGGGGVHRAEEAFKKTGLLEWGLGDAVTLKAGRPPLPILPPPPPKKGPTLPTVFAPSVSRETTGSASASGGGGRLDVPPLVQSISAPDSMGGWSSMGDGGWSTEGWSTEEEGSWRGQQRGPREGEAASGGVAPGAGGWSSFGLPPLVPLDHPVEPLFQVLVEGDGRGRVVGWALLSKHTWKLTLAFTFE